MTNSADLTRLYRILTSAVRREAYWAYKLGKPAATIEAGEGVHEYAGEIGAVLRAADGSVVGCAAVERPVSA